MKNKVVLITACGNKKEDRPTTAGRLYKSPRIRYLNRKSRELQIPFFILSAKYGLISSEEVIAPYDETLTEKKCQKLLIKIIDIVSQFDTVIFYRGGAKKTYFNCIKKAVEKVAGKKFIYFGYGNMGDINKIKEIIERAISHPKKPDSNANKKK